MEPLGGLSTSSIVLQLLSLSDRPRKTIKSTRYLSYVNDEMKRDMTVYNKGEWRVGAKSDGQYK